MLGWKLVLENQQKTSTRPYKQQRREGLRREEPQKQLTRENFFWVELLEKKVELQELWEGPARLETERLVETQSPVSARIAEHSVNFPLAARGYSDP